jgi:hypothetical protein
MSPRATGVGTRTLSVRKTAIIESVAVRMNGFSLRREHQHRAGFANGGDRALLI